MTKSVLIVGAGAGLSASLARKCNEAGMKVSFVARNTEKLKKIAEDLNARVFSCDASDIEQVSKLFSEHDRLDASLDLVIYNPSARLYGSIEELNPNEAKKAVEITGFGAFLVAQQAAKRMLKQGYGSIFFTGASASIKGFANSSVFAMGKFQQRGLAQALARELHPKNIHVGHFIIDGSITNKFENSKDERLHSDSIADAYLYFHNQHRSAWSWEIQLRPWLENF